jgi:REP element-mobilizing transposase RayT
MHGADTYHHIYAWGNDRHPVFKRPVHFQKYLVLLAENSKSFKISVIAYALMDWHVHLFVYDRLDSISDFVMKLHGEYAKYFNRNANRTGHVFGERFNNKVINANAYGIWLSRYIHRQALEATLVQNPRDYPWTSYRCYLGMERNTFLKPDIVLNQFGDKEAVRLNYEEFVLSDNVGPVDWTKRTFTLRAGEELIEFVGKEMAIDRSILLYPQGVRERQMRRTVIRTLAVKYGYKSAAIASSLRLSRAAVGKILS